MIFDQEVAELLARIGLRPEDLPAHLVDVVRDHLSPAAPKDPPMADEETPLSLATPGDALREHLGLPPSEIAMGARKLRSFLDAATPAAERDALWPAVAARPRPIRRLALEALRSSTSTPDPPTPGDDAA